MKNGRPQLKDVPVLDVLRAIDEHARDRFERFPPKLLYAWLETKQGSETVEYGTGERCCWLTSEGERVMENEKRKRTLDGCAG